jgi:hypothetical protein
MCIYFSNITSLHIKTKLKEINGIIKDIDNLLKCSYEFQKVKLLKLKGCTLSFIYIILSNNYKIQ